MGAQGTYRTSFEIVGAFYFTEDEARAHDNGALASATTYSAEVIVAGREQVEAELEAECGVAFVPRGMRARVRGRGRAELALPHLYPRELLSCVIDGVPLSQGELDEIILRPEGVAFRPGNGWPESATNPDNIVLHYTHGYDAPPGSMKHASLVLLRHRLVPSAIDDTAASFTDELGTRSFAGPPFGIRTVNEACRRHGERIPAIG
jgi:hypothetical protein